MSNANTTNSLNGPVIEVGGSGYDLTAGALLLVVGALMGALGLENLASNPHWMGMLFGLPALFAWFYGLVLLSVRHRVEFVGQGAARRTSSVFGRQIWTSQYECGCFSELSVRGTEQKPTESGLVGTVRSFAAPPYSVVLCGSEGREIHLGHWWYFAGAMSAAVALGRAEGLRVWDQTSSEHGRA